MTKHAGQGDHAEFIAMTRRILRALARRVGSADPEDLAEIIDLRGEVDTVITRSVVGLRQAGFSWQQIADALGVTRQAAQQRYGATAR